MTPATDFERLVDRLIFECVALGRVEPTEARAAVIAAYNELAAECQEQARLNGMGSEREVRLQARLAECEAKAGP